MTVLPGVGHYPMEEIDGFAALLDLWLRALTGAATATSAGAR
jgi:hypothetical protein